uniref:Uncharacterized protein n=1 Tax=Sparus aurata TaxID=8175 RepID=A0A671U970_SPAAU
ISHNFKILLSFQSYSFVQLFPHQNITTSLTSPDHKTLFTGVVVLIFELKCNVSVAGLGPAGAVVDKVLEQLPEEEAKASAVVGHYHDEDGIFALDAKGPNAGAEVGVSGKNSGVKAFARAEVGSVAGSIGPVTGTLGLSADTGAHISKTQLEAKVLGTGISFGREMGVSILGTGFKFKLW